MKRSLLLLFVFISLSSRSQDSLTKLHSNNYSTKIATADSLLSLQKYTEARDSYMHAIEIIYGDTMAMKYPLKKLKEIDQIFSTRSPAPQWSLVKIDSLIEISDVVIESSVYDFNCHSQFDVGTFECYFRLYPSSDNYLYSWNPFNEKTIHFSNDTIIQRKLSGESISVSYIFACNGFDFNYKSIVDTNTSTVGIFFIRWDSEKGEFKLIDVMYDNSIQQFEYSSEVSSNEYYIRQKYHDYKERNIYLGKKNYIKVVRTDLNGNGQIQKKTKILYVTQPDKDRFGMPILSHKIIKSKTKIYQ